MKVYLTSLCALLLCVFSSSLTAQESKHKLIVVVTPDWQSFQAQMFCWEKDQDGWHLQKIFPAVVGRTGLAWGVGKDTDYQKPKQKREGDGKAPAGLFALRTCLYGYAKEAPGKLKWEYQQLTASLRGVDDPKSRYYNQIVDLQKVKQPDWDSAEVMRRKDHLYRWLMVVEHNTAKPQPGMGSCIFMHIWRGPQSPTAGCTALAEKNLLWVIKWLQDADKPQLLQVPWAEYSEFQKKYSFPQREAFKNNNRRK